MTSVTSAASAYSEVNPTVVGPVEDRSTIAPVGSPGGGAGDEEPLLGNSGTTRDHNEDKGLFNNLVSGTAPLAQAGGFFLVVIVWVSVFTHRLLIFSGHPLLNSFAILFTLEAILILQPTGHFNPVAKKKAAYIHATFVALAAVCFYSALGIVIFHKERYHIPHFETWHSKLGIATYGLLLLQALVGFTQLFVPQLYGGEDNAKKIYKYHRFFGYAVILPLILVTLTLATKTPYVEHVLKIRMWAVVLCAVAIVAGLYPRVNVSKINVRGR